MEDLISPRQFQLKRLFIARLIHRCGYFVVKVGERYGSLPCEEGARDLTWILEKVLGLPAIYLPDPFESKGQVNTTFDMCMWVMRLSSSVTAHLLDSNIWIFNNCWLLIILKNTSKHWVLCCSQATQALSW